MQYRFFKIVFIVILFSISAILPFCIDTSLSGKTVEAPKEKITEEIRNEINLILHQEKITAIDSIMNLRYKRYGFNGNILVAIDGQSIYNSAFGYSNFRAKEKLAPESCYQLASVSKQFTAVAIMLLKEQGELAYDDTITKYIDVPYDQMTICQLLNHTSGLANYMWLVEHHWKGDHPPYNDDIVKLLKEHNLPVYFSAGRRFDYSNTGYILLAAIVESVSGQRFDQFLKENIFDPLGMHNSFVFSTSYPIKTEAKIKGYYKRGSRYREIPETINDGAVGDKGICSTTEDLLKWDQALYSNTLLSQSTLQEAFSPLMIRNKYKVNYGYGFRIKESENNKLIYHHGRWNGFRTSLMRYVSDSTTIIVLNNTSYSGNTSIIKAIRNEIAKNDDLTDEITHTLIDKDVDQVLFELSNSDAIKNNLLNIQKLASIKEFLVKKNMIQIAEKFDLVLDQFSSQTNYAYRGGMEHDNQTASSK